jgi:periplasmic protein TonB
MNGYKTGGDWTDVTSIGRNEVVFEGRHKDYGAFYIRQRYPNALLFAFLTALTFVALCAIIPYALRGAVHLAAAAKTDIIVAPADVLIHKRFSTPPPLPPHQRVQPPKFTPNRFFPPQLTRQPIDSAPIKPDNHSVVTTTTGTPGTDNGPIDIDQGDNGDHSLVPPNSDKPLMWVKEMPKFPGGSVSEYLASHINYPAEAVQLGVQGTAYVSFIIEKDGTVSNVKLERPISNGPDLNKEALRVLSEMPNWAPGKQDGHPVRVQFMVPIRFKLN